MIYKNWDLVLRLYKQLLGLRVWITDCYWLYFVIYRILLGYNKVICVKKVNVKFLRALWKCMELTFETFAYCKIMFTFAFVMIDFDDD